LIDGRAAAAMYRSRVSVGAVLLMVLAALVAVTTALLVSGVGGALSVLVNHVWSSTWTRVITLAKELG
jgi:uncharacterized membrane-anchored protein